MREVTKIPLMSVDGLEYLEIRPSDFGDPYSVTLVLPARVLESGKLHLPRKMFSEELELPPKKFP